jgi:hypothetical protein
MADLLKKIKRNKPNRKRKGKIRDNSLPIPDYVSTFLAFMRSNCGGSHFNIEIIQHHEDTNEWSTKPTQALIRGGIRKKFYSKALPRSITERIVLVEESGLAKQSVNGSGNNKLYIILHCYTIAEIKELDEEGMLPPNYLAYTDSNRLAMGEKINIGEQSEVVIEFNNNDQDSSDDLFEGGDSNLNDAENDEENSESNSDDDEEKKKKDTKDTKDKKKDKKKDKNKIKNKKGGAHRGGGADWFNSI